MTMDRIIVYGADRWPGNFISRYFQLHHDVLDIHTKSDIMLSGGAGDIIKKYHISHRDTVINAARVYFNDIDFLTHEAHTVNSVIPHKWTSVAFRTRAQVIHLGGTEVFDGIMSSQWDGNGFVQSNLVEHQSMCPRSEFGMSRAVGELANMLIKIRVELLPEFYHSETQLAEWILRDCPCPAGDVAYNRISCLELCHKIQDNFIKTNSDHRCPGNWLLHSGTSGLQVNDRFLHSVIMDSAGHDFVYEAAGNESHHQCLVLDTVRPEFQMMCDLSIVDQVEQAQQFSREHWNM